MSDFKAVIELTRFNHAQLTEVEIGGVKTMAITIPLEVNGLYLGKHSKVLAYMKVIERAPNAYGQSHMIFMSIAKKREALLKELGLRPPFLGSLIPTR